MRGAILSGWVGPTPPDIFRRASENHRAYADTHGYEYVFSHHPENDLVSANGDALLPHWMKVRMVLEWLSSGFDWVIVNDRS